LVKQRAEETELKPLYALWPLRRHQLHRLLLLLLLSAGLTCLLYLRQELFAHRPHLLLYPLPHGLPEVLMEPYQDGLHGLC
jgi:hypothetical protein